MAKKKTKKPVKKAAKKTAPKKKVAQKVAKRSAKKTAKPSTAELSASIRPAEVILGKPVRDFTIDSTGNKAITLSALQGKKVVLFFYPKDSTPGCTMEGHDFSRLYSQFEANNAVVFGLSRDTLKSHENFKAKENYCLDLLSDADEQLCQRFGVIKMKNMYGKQVRGIERSTFVIDPSGILVKEWRGVKVPGHADEVLNFIKTI